MVIPDGGHRTDGRSCWCVPRLEQPCLFCDTLETGDCPHCGGTGMIEAYTDDQDCPTLVIHNDIPFVSVN